MICTHKVQLCFCRMLQLVHSLSKFHLTVILLNLCVAQSEVFVRGESSQKIDSSPPRNCESVVKNVSYWKRKLLPTSVFKGMNKTCEIWQGGPENDNSQNTGFTSLM